ncbi:MAG: isoprenylcysteine carboxylmethyltransferase family protein [Candidatus Marinimicrobia bacterium]|nr:isoprenylcysteine carboxylmethyltransferase family protein [Candidatus Neomarinimicrobiota bacterium]
MKSLTDTYLSAKPGVKLFIELIGCSIIIAIGLLFPDPKIPFRPFTNILGFVFIVGGLWLHGLSHSVHKQVHQETEKIEKLITMGIYSKIRYPGYLGLILVYIGVPFAWGSVFLFIPTILFSYPLYTGAKKEEELLKDKFGREYENYMKRVPWRFIPKII